MTTRKAKLFSDYLVDIRKVYYLCIANERETDCKQDQKRCGSSAG